MKTVGQPVQENKAEIKESNFYSTIAVNFPYIIYVKVKNVGQSIWGQKGEVKLSPIQGGVDLGMGEAKVPPETQIEPGQEYTFSLPLQAPKLGQFKGAVALFQAGIQFEGQPYYFSTSVKEP